MNKIIDEIFSEHQVRKTQKQKNKFIEYTTQKASELGWQARVEKGSLGVQNIVVGNPDTAKTIYTAHYDTCARLPFPNFLTPKNIFIYILFNIAVILGFFAVAIGIGFVVGVICGLTGIDAEIAALLGELIYIIMIITLIAGPANKHTANDNTSGVTVLFGIMKNLPEHLRDKVAFVFFDCEEMGLFGSSAFAKAHKEVKDNTLVINYDCVSDGKDMLIVAKKNAKQYSDLLSQSFISNDDISVTVTEKAFYPSDQVKFKNGVGVATFKKTKGGLLYMNRIHTNRDTVYRRENIDFLIEKSIKLVERI